MKGKKTIYLGTYELLKGQDNQGWAFFQLFPFSQVKGH